MSLLFIAPDRDLSSWEDAIHSIDPNIEIDIWPDIKDKNRVQFTVCWNHPSIFLTASPILKLFHRWELELITCFQISHFQNRLISVALFLHRWSNK